MKRTAVINVVALSKGLIGENMPNISEFLNKGESALINPTFPAITCSAQSNYLTGSPPQQHGIVGNCWFDRDLNELMFWKQSNRLVKGKKIWEELREIYPSFKCAKLFWWFNMYSSADYSMTPRPIYTADGRKIFNIYTEPFSIKDEVENAIGKFPFPTFWGPFAGVESKAGKPDAASRWIANAAMWTEDKFQPHLNLIYLPHLDYNLQRYGTNIDLIKNDLIAIDTIVGDLIRFFKQRSVQIILLSEYGINDSDKPIFLNRVFREKGWIKIKEELGREMLDCGASKTFALSDHQIAHIYINDKSIISQVKNCVENQPGILLVLDDKLKSDYGIDHQRAGDLIAIPKSDYWFSYYYWCNDKKAPDFAPTVDIHRKPGYDPVELFLQQTPLINLKILFRILQSKLGFRTLLDIIPLDANLVKGSHAAPPADKKYYPVIIAERPGLLGKNAIDSTDVYQIIKRAVLDN